MKKILEKLLEFSWLFIGIGVLCMVGGFTTYIFKARYAQTWFNILTWIVVISGFIMIWGGSFLSFFQRKIEKKLRLFEYDNDDGSIDLEKIAGTKSSHTGKKADS